MLLTEKPFEWPATKGLCKAQLLIDYEAWVRPHYTARWDKNGQLQTLPTGAAQRVPEPWLPRKNSGTLTVRKDLIPLAQNISKGLQPWSLNSPFHPPRARGPLLIHRDLIPLAEKVNHWLATKKKAQTAPSTA